MKLKAAGKTHIGKKRKDNEDKILISSALGLFIVADGMGGHKAGDVASRMVVDTMESYWSKVKGGDPPPFIRSVDKNMSDRANHLINSISYTNIVIHEAQKKRQYRRMGSTIAALLVENEMLWAANVGDSRIYLHDKNRLVQISEDHSLASEQKNLGLISESGEDSLMSNLLTRVLGNDKTVAIHIEQVMPKVGDQILMCSDGLTNFTEERTIQTVLNDISLPLERRVDILTEEALRGGGGDNISVVVLEVMQERKWDKLKNMFHSRGSI